MPRVHPYFWWTVLPAAGEDEPPPPPVVPMARSDRQVYDAIQEALERTGLFDQVFRSSEPMREPAPSWMRCFAHVQQGQPSRSTPDADNRHRKVRTGTYTLSVCCACGSDAEGRDEAWRALDDADAIVRGVLEGRDFDGLVIGRYSDLGDGQDELGSSPDVRKVYRRATFTYVVPTPASYRIGVV